MNEKVTVVFKLEKTKCITNNNSLGNILQLLMSLSNLATLIPNLQSEFTHQVTLFFAKLNLNFIQKRM